MVDINLLICELVNYAEKNCLLDKRDKIYASNKLIDVLKLSEYNMPDCHISIDRDLEAILEDIRKWAVENNRVENDSVDVLDIFDTKVMDTVIKLPSEIEREFYDKYKLSPSSATEYFYSFSKKSNYIREDRIKKDIRWKYETEYGMLDITINMSKPEKDPRAIARAKEITSAGYPKCMLCKENEGYRGRLDFPPRSNHRVIGIDLSGERWYLQYSPYIYYNEHCIVFKDDHVPMKLTKKTFDNLLEFVQKFPHYFIGSNADLPIVGGSILSHDHFQGGNYSFAMAQAKEENHIVLSNNISACTLKWPMSVIRLKGIDKNSLADLSYEIYTRWKSYNDIDSQILSHSSETEHNTITPICRNRNGLIEIDLVLRNNRTTENRPYGIFHPREEYHHIKKENIGLIEVMGLAVLPSRLNNEMDRLKEYLLDNNLRGIKYDRDLSKHYEWSEMILNKYRLTDENISEIIRNEISEVFVKVLKDAAVFKDDESGKEAFKKCFEILIN